MMHNIMISIGFALIWVVFFSIYGNKFPPKWLDFKPFNCYICLSFWCAIAHIIWDYYIGTMTFDMIAYGGYAAYGAMFFNRLRFK